MFVLVPHESNPARALAVRRHPPDDVLHIDVPEPLLHHLGIDPYADTAFAGPDLATLATTVRTALDARRRQVGSDLAIRLGHPEVPDWAGDLLAQSLADDATLASLTALAQLIARAEASDGTVLFLGD